MKKELVFVIILVVLVAISLIQAIQLNGLKAEISELGTKGAASQKISVASGKTSGSASIPSSAQQLPQMVGGC